MGLLGRLRKRAVSSLWRDRKIIPVVTPTEHPRVSGKTALVTGGTGGIGLAIAEELSRFGCAVVVGGTNEQRLEAIRAGHGERGWTVATIDYSSIDTLEQQLSRVIEEHGPFDYYVSSAGVHTENVDFSSITAEEFDRVMAINLRGTYFATKLVTEDMVRHGIHGGVVLVGSSRGLEPAWSPYGISKWGLHGMALGFAQLLARYGISVNAVAPGPTATSLIGYEEGGGIESGENAFGRMAVPEEVAALVRSVLIEGSELITGEIISISGGRGRFELR